MKNKVHGGKADGSALVPLGDELASSVPIICQALAP